MDTMMENLWDNHLAVRGSPEDVARFKKRAVGFLPWNEPDIKPRAEILNFHSLVPVPLTVRAAGYDPAGFEWEYLHWGCNGAWDSHTLDEDEDLVVYRFDTAWSPPLAFVEQVSKAWPGLEFELEFEEPAMGFKGQATCQRGNWQTSV